MQSSNLISRWLRVWEASVILTNQNNVQYNVSNDNSKVSKTGHDDTSCDSLTFLWRIIGGSNWRFHQRSLMQVNVIAREFSLKLESDNNYLKYEHSEYESSIRMRLINFPRLIIDWPQFKECLILPRNYQFWCKLYCWKQ